MANHNPRFTSQPVYWFLLYEAAVLRGDDVAKLEAQQRLKRLGVKVQYHPHAPRAAEVHDARR